MVISPQNKDTTNSCSSLSSLRPAAPQVLASVIPVLHYGG